MSIRRTLQGILISLALILIPTAANTESTPDEPKPVEKFDNASPAVIPDQTVGYDGKPSRNDGRPIIHLRSSSTNSPGNLIGNTYNDYQQTGGLGRKIALGYPPAEHTHMIWSYIDTSNLAVANFELRYQVYTMGAYVYPAGGIPATTQPNTVEGSLGVLADNRAVVGSDPYFYDSSTVANIESDLVPGIFIQHFLRPDTLAGWYVNGMRTLFPATEVHFGTDTVIYVLNSAYNSNDGWSGFVLYRKVGDGDFDNGQMIESRFCYAYTIVARQNTDSVALIYFDTVEGGSGDNFDRNIVYRLSTDQGLTWGPQTNISHYAPDSLFRAYVDVSALWDSHGDLHVVWNARIKDSSGYRFYQCRIFHWSTADERISTVTEARYPAECTSDLNDMNAGKPSISLCEDKLYVVWTQYNDEDVLNDCSDAGFANGELYMSVSGDYGLTWDTAVNLTDTRTPGCVSGECESDIFPSMTRYGAEYPDARDSLDIIYINDKDAGVALYTGGNWTLNNVMHYRLPCYDVAHTLYCNPGDANSDLQIDIGDAVYIINYIFKGGSAPTPYEICSGDPNGDCTCDIGDAVHLINYIFKSGPAPASYFEWYTACGTPSR